MVSKGGKSRKGDADHDIDQNGQFQEFDVMQEPASAAEAAEATMEALGALSDSQDELTSLIQARDELEQRLMSQPPAEASVEAASAADEEVYGLGNIVGIGIGEKEVDGHPTGQLAVKVLVKEKRHSDQVSSEAAVPRSVGGVRTDVEDTGEIRAQMFTARRRPAPGGVSIGNCRQNHAGTLGCLVTRGNQLFILSNNHVMAVVNTSPLGEGISQPGRLDGGTCPNDIIARLTQFVPINFAPGVCNHVDAAIAQTSPNFVDRRILRPGGVLQRLGSPIQAPPVLNTQVQKSGRTTQYRRGIIDLLNVTVNISYAPIAGVARFCGQFRVKGIPGPFSDRGDSGSLVTTFPDNRPVGLLFAGNAANNQTFCNPIRDVLAAFGVSIVF